MVTDAAFFRKTMMLARHVGRTNYGVYLRVIIAHPYDRLFLDFRTRKDDGQRLRWPPTTLLITEV
jgi:hypothetical protein